MTPSENIQSSSNTSKPTPFTDLFSKVPQKQSTPAGLAKRFGFKGITIPPSLPDTLKLTIDFQKREKIVTEMAHKNTVSLLHIQTLFSSLLDDRDNALIKTQKTCSEKTILVDKISRLDSQINKLMASKQKLEVKLSEIVEIETNQLETCNFY